MHNASIVTCVSVADAPRIKKKNTSGNKIVRVQEPNLIESKPKKLQLPDKKWPDNKSCISRLHFLQPKKGPLILSSRFKSVEELQLDLTWRIITRTTVANEWSVLEKLACFDQKENYFSTDTFQMLYLLCRKCQYKRVISSND